MSRGRTDPTASARSSVVRVAQASATFWAVKGLSTALGESTSDYLVFAVNPVLAVLGTFALFLAALAVQLSRSRYTPWAYWSAVVMVGVFGTMAADVVHVVLHVPYVVSSLGYGLGLALVFGTWRRLEGSLAVHDVTTLRREVLYWAAVAATFATGTAVGDLSAITWHLGYGGSIVAFAVAICVPAVGYRWWRWDATLSFWAAYVITRPLGASVADWTGKPTAAGGLGFGDGTMSLLFAVAIVVLVARSQGASYTEAALPAEARPLARHATVLSGWSRLKAPMGGSARTRGEDA